jgi:hypothetical protein
MDYCRATFGGNGQYCRIVSPSRALRGIGTRRDKTGTAV